MNRTSIAIAFLLTATVQPAAATSDVGPLKNLAEPCNMIENDPQSCFRIVGCIGQEGEFFIGRAVGWAKGSFTATTSTGSTCKGEWTYRSFLDMGKSRLICDNGETTDVTFFSRSKGKSFSSGQGLSSKNRRFLVWIGNDVVSYFKEVKEDGTTGLKCGPVLIPFE